MQTNKSKILKCATLIFGVLIIPMIYGGVYLASVWDAYGKLDLLPVAVVNQDKGAEINGEFKNMGEELVKNLEENKTLDWNFVSAEEAEAGLESGNQYYAVITIPSNFSSSIASAQTVEKTPATITYSSNEKRNYIATTILKSAMSTLENNIRASVTEEITGQLTDQLNQVPEQLSTLNDGLLQLDEGGTKLDQGVSQLLDGSKSLSENLGVLNNGLTQAQAGSQTLSDATNKLPTLVDGVKTLNDGANQLADGLTQADNGTAKLYDGSKELTENMGTLSDGLIKASEGVQTLKDATENLPTLTEGVKALDDGAKELANGLNDAYDGAKELNTGAKKLDDLKDGLKTLNTGAANLADKSAEYAAGIQQYTSAVDDLIGQVKQQFQDQLDQLEASGLGNSDAANTLKTKMAELETLQGTGSVLAEKGKELSAGVSKVSQGAEELNNSRSKLTELQNGISDLTSGLKTLHAGGKTLTEGTGTLMAGTSQMSQLQEGVNSLNSAMQQLQSGSSQLYNGSQSLQNGLGDLKSATNQLTAGGLQVANGTKTLVDSTSQLGELQNGVQSLNEALVKLQSGSSQLYDGSKTLESGLSDAKTGSSQLSEGIHTAQSSVTESIDSTKEKLKATDGLADFTANSVVTEAKPYDSVENYGSAFAPYFLCVSLWTGGLTMMLSVYLDLNKRMKVLSPDSNRRILRMGIFFGLGLAQAMLVGVVVHLGLGLQINHVLGFYAGLLLTSLTFMAMIQFFIVHLGDVGKLLSMIFLVLQLTSTGGTFPVEMTPPFFQFINHFVPMSYSIQMLKEVVSGNNMAYAWQNAGILSIFFVTFTGLTLILAIVKQHKEKNGKQRKNLSEFTEESKVLETISQS